SEEANLENPNCQITNQYTLRICNAVKQKDRFLSRFSLPTPQPQQLQQFFNCLRENNMSLACLVCHSIESPSHSFRSYSVSSSDNEGRCFVVASCLTRKFSLPNPTITSSKVMPQPIISSGGVTGAPRLVRSRAVRRDLVRDWNFDGEMED
ncbi:dihydroorotate dehydrogenase, partial [Striga asiatica]